jgi:hypothetical protein
MDNTPTSNEPSQGELVFWQSIKDSKDPAEFASYLSQFPAGFFRQLARNRLIALGVTPPADAPPLPAGSAPSQSGGPGAGYPPASQQTVAPAPSPGAPPQAMPDAGQTGANGKALIWASLIFGLSVVGAVWLWASITSYSDCVNVGLLNGNSRYYAEKDCRPDSP